MPILTQAIQAYFVSLNSRIHTAPHIPFRNIASEQWQPKQSDCHRNADRWVAVKNARERIRGWHTWGIGGLGSFMFVAHSVIGEAGVLYDIRVDRRDYSITEVSAAPRACGGLRCHAA